MPVKQISVFLENKSGRLYDLAKVLGDNQINMIALTVAETGDYGVVRIIADKAEKAVQVLKDNGFTVSETDVIGVVVPDRPGGLASVLEVLKGNNLNIEYLYCFAGPTKDTAIDIMRIEDVTKAEDIIRRSGFEVLEKIDTID
ncbi:MAG: hypothetical protein N2440_01370 [Actinobacteria bacterium]|nr:hypothetical protein [Actinomycetota bacterium]